MAEHNDLGKRGEELAVSYLLSDEHRILATNYRFSRAEIDIIAMKDDVLIFVEVKSRTSSRHGAPEGSITSKKISLMMDAAYRFMEEINHQWEIRFDVITLILPRRGDVELNHLKDAFVP